MPVSLSHPDRFVSRHIGPSETEARAMLDAVGATSLDALVEQTVPASIRLERALDLPAARREDELLAYLETIAAKNEIYR